MPLVPIAGVLGGCMGCMVVVENIAKQQPSSMNLMTFSTFAFIALHGLVFTSKFFSVPNKIPLKGYIPTVVTFFVVNVINNQALNFHVPVPLHIIFRSVSNLKSYNYIVSRKKFEVFHEFKNSTNKILQGSLLANMVLSVILLRKSYSLRKYLSVFAITMGIVICTLATSSLEKDSGLSYEEAVKHYREWVIGILMLSFALIASAYLAICQQKMYENYGKHPNEAMFVTVSTIYSYSCNDLSKYFINYMRIFHFSHMRCIGILARHISSSLCFDGYIL
uniref:Magnesium transporter n=1 Tax=Heterorhabditis bacteriophora TaxID=37862 RepID=A0A1I7XC07_HETBA